MSLRLWLLVAVVLCATAHAHPRFLECGGLSARLNANKTVMSRTILRGKASTAPFKIIDHHSSGPLRNYTIFAEKGYEFVIQSTDGSNLTNYGTGSFACGATGHGLCAPCVTARLGRHGIYAAGPQLYAMSGDCTPASAEAARCAFGVSGGGAVLVGAASFSEGPEAARGHVTAVAFNL